MSMALMCLRSEVERGAMSFYRGMTSDNNRRTWKSPTFVKMIQPGESQRGKLWRKVVFETADKLLVIFPVSVFAVAPPGPVY